MNNKLRILFILVTFVFFIVIIFIVPVKKAQKIESKSIKQEKISMNDKLIICECDNTVTGPPWSIVGKNNMFFNLTKPCEYIVLEGNLPKYFLKSKLINSPNKFIFEGDFIGKRIIKYEGGVYKVFKVKKWSIIYPINRENGLFTRLSKTSITVYDYLPFP